MVRNEKGVLYRRRKVPSSFTRGPAVYAADLVIFPPYLKRGYLTSEKLLPCVAEIDPEGAIELLPYWDKSENGHLNDTNVPFALPAESATMDVLDTAADPIPEVLPWNEHAPAVVLAMPEPVEEALPASNQRKKSHWPIFLLLGLLALGLVGAGGGLLWWVQTRNKSQTVTLSNARTEARMGLTWSIAVDYEVNQIGFDSEANYYLMVRSTRSGMVVENRIEMASGQTKGTVKATSVVIASPLAGSNESIELYLEAESARNKGNREKVSNVVTLR
jgi:hypothetical protein